jgi:5-methylcytosine-specific restriction endonuclease McrA
LCKRCAADRALLLYNANKEARDATHDAWRKANLGRGVEYYRRWYKKHPEKYALKNRESASRRQAGTKASRIAYETVLERDGMVCHICSIVIADMSDLHFDHVIPLARGGAHHADNIKPAHALCNLQKGAKIA